MQCFRAWIEKREFVKAFVYMYKSMVWGCLVWAFLIPARICEQELWLALYGETKKKQQSVLECGTTS